MPFAPLEQLLCNHLSGGTAGFILSEFKSKSYKKGVRIIEEGEICNYLFFVEKGLLKLSTYHKGREFVMQFFIEGVFFTVLDSFTNQIPSDFEITTLEDCELKLIHRRNYEKLCTDDHATAQFFRLVSQQALSQMMTRMSSRLKYEAAERYELFLRTYAHVVQRISLGDMANFLGITQVSLSRIRAGK